MTVKNTRRRPNRQPKEPTHEEVKAVVKMVIAMNEPALRALARR